MTDNEMRVRPRRAERHERLRAALAEAGRPDLGVVVRGRVGLTFDWTALGREPTLAEVGLVAKAHDLIDPVDYERTSDQEWLSQIQRGIWWTTR